MEPETDQAWTSGKYAFMRNWTYAYAADQTGGSKVKGKYAVAPLPSFEGAGRANILGGHNSVISVYTKNPGLSLKFSDYVASPEWQKISLNKYSQRGDPQRDVRRSGRQEGGPVRGRAQGRSRPGEGPSGLAGVSADLAGDLQERQRRSCRSDESGGRDQEGQRPDQQRVVDLLI